MRRRESGAIEDGGSVVNARKKLAGAGSWQRLTPPPLGCRHRSPAVLSETGTTETCAAMRCSAVRTWWNSASPSGYIEQHQTGSCYAVRRSDSLQYNICLPVTQKRQSPLTVPGCIRALDTSICIAACHPLISLSISCLPSPSSDPTLTAKTEDMWMSGSGYCVFVRGLQLVYAMPCKSSLEP